MAPGLHSTATQWALEVPITRDEGTLAGGGVGVHGEHSGAVTPGGKEGTQARALQVEGKAYSEVFIQLPE